jgi:hypothetical protein
MVEVAIVKVVDMISVTDGSVPTVGTVLVRMMGTVKLCTCWHGWPPGLMIEQNIRPQALRAV